MKYQVTNGQISITRKPRGLMKKMTVVFFAQEIKLKNEHDWSCKNVLTSSFMETFEKKEKYIHIKSCRVIFFFSKQPIFIDFTFRGLIGTRARGTYAKFGMTNSQPSPC